MKTLIVEDDVTSRVLLEEILGAYGRAHVAVNGKEAVTAVKASLDSGKTYDLICMDIMMPEMDGHEALREIRAMEAAYGIPNAQRAVVIMTTALHDAKNVMAAIAESSDAYLVKPIHKAKLLEKLSGLRLI